MAKQGVSDADYEKLNETIGKNLPIRRTGLPDEIAHAILFLADNTMSVALVNSFRAGYIVGQTLVVDGGEMIHHPVISFDSMHST